MIEVVCELLDTCPSCGAMAITVVCRVTAVYMVENEDGEQNWITDEVDDDSSIPQYFKCDGCGMQFDKFQLNEAGYLVNLVIPGPPPPSLTEQEFVDWLNQECETFCERIGADPDADDVDHGDLWRTFESDVAYKNLGFRFAVDHEGRLFFFSGRDQDGIRWVVAIPFEVGIEGNTIWLSPLHNLLWGESMSDQIQQTVERMRQRLDDLNALLD